MTQSSSPVGRDVDGDRPDLCGGDLESIFQRLFDEYADGLRRYLASRIGSGAADDLLSETFLIALQRRASYDRSLATVRSWLYGIATNLIRRHAEAEHRQLRLAARSQHAQVTHGHADRVAERVDAQIRVRQLSAALSRLTAGDRDVLLLSSWAGLDATEIGAALGIPAGTARSRLHRVRQLLRAVAARGVKQHEGGERADG